MRRAVREALAKVRHAERFGTGALGLARGAHRWNSRTSMPASRASRIVCWVHENQTVARGQPFGLIQFGSQVDMTFPASARLRIQVGDRVKGGATVLAHLQPQAAFSAVETSAAERQ